VGMIGRPAVTLEISVGTTGAAEVRSETMEGTIGTTAETTGRSVTTETTEERIGAREETGGMMEVAPETIGTTPETTGRSVTTETMEERIGATEETGGMMEDTAGTEMGRDGRPAVTEGIATVGTTVGTEIKEVTPGIDTGRVGTETTEDKPGSDTGRVVGTAGVTEGIATVGTTDGRTAPPERPRAARIWARLPAPRMLMGMVTVLPLRTETQLKFRRF
jgi:hypothetical protein